MAVTALAIGAAIWLRPPARNPDPNHTHADFAVWINGTKLDFSATQYMSGISTDPATHPDQGPQKYLHLHDGNGHVIHRHKPGLTLREFFESLGTTFRNANGNMDLCVDFPQMDEVCQNEAMHRNWAMVVNGEHRFFDPAYVFQDGDQILIDFSEDETQDTDARMTKEWEDMTGDACLYSRLCPWRGDPPTENCIADPEVPCVAS